MRQNTLDKINRDIAELKELLDVVHPEKVCMREKIKLELDTKRKEIYNLTGKSLDIGNE